jgi:hypothetical protein
MVGQLGRVLLEIRMDMWWNTTCFMGRWGRNVDGDSWNTWHLWVGVAQLEWAHLKDIDCEGSTAVFNFGTCLHKNHLCLSAVYGAAGRYIDCVYSSLLTSRPKSNQGDVSILGTARFPEVSSACAKSSGGCSPETLGFTQSCFRAEPLKRRGSNPPEIQDGSGTSWNNSPVCTLW